MARKVLVCSVNWLGDLVMSLPALQLYKASRPDSEVAFLAKPGIAALLSLSPLANTMHKLSPGTLGTLRAGRALKWGGYDEAVMLPNSFRSALVPFLAGIPRRRGTPGHWRRLLLTDAVDSTPVDTSRVHQSWEYARLLGLSPLPDALPAPELVVPPGTRDACVGRLRLQADAPWIALIPGAARGPSKRWPPDSFAAVGRELAARHGARILVMGAPNERDLCCQVSAAVGDAAVNIGGQTSVVELVALLSECRVAVTNDSGGMHLACAAGTAVAAVFGITDASRTGPMGSRCRVIHAAGTGMGRVSRDIPRDSTEAIEALSSIAVATVRDAATALMEERPT